MWALKPHSPFDFSAGLALWGHVEFCCNLFGFFLDTVVEAKSQQWEKLLLVDRCVWRLTFTTWLWLWLKLSDFHYSSDLVGVFLFSFSLLLTVGSTLEHLLSDGSPLIWGCGQTCDSEPFSVRLLPWSMFLQTTLKQTTQSDSDRVTQMLSRSLCTYSYINQASHCPIMHLSMTKSTSPPSPISRPLPRLPHLSPSPFVLWYECALMSNKWPCPFWHEQPVPALFSQQLACAPYLASTYKLDSSASASSALPVWLWSVYGYGLSPTPSCFSSLELL